MDAHTLILLRFAVALAGMLVAYVFYRWIQSRHATPERQDRLLLGAYVATRLGIWLLFLTYLQQFPAGSDTRRYQVLLDHFLAGLTPIRDFYYPYGPLLAPVMLPFYTLLGRSLAGISLFAIFAEAIALFFFVKSTALLRERGEMDRTWAREALAVYLLNPATLYWVVTSGYHSIAQTPYAMAALYFLLRGYSKTGYALGMLGVPGAKFIAVLDWPALLVVRRPSLSKLLLGAIPLVLVYAVFQKITGDILFPIRFHLGYRGEGNLWYLLTLFGDLKQFYSSFPGYLLPVVSFGLCFLAGSVLWLRALRLGLTSFSFQTAIGVTTFTMSLFFIFSLYTGSYYMSVLALQASMVVTCPSLRSRHGVWLVLLIAGAGIIGDTLYALIASPVALKSVISSGSADQRLLAGLYALTTLIRISCFAMLARLGWRVATLPPSSSRVLSEPFRIKGSATVS